MKNLLLIALTVGCFSCQPIIKNEPETLEIIFDKSSFDIEIQNWGCFDSGTETFTVTKGNGGHELKSNRTGRSHLLTNPKIDSLKNYLTTKIGKNEYGGCTNSEYIRIGSFFNSVDYEHSFCSGTQATFMNDLLNYYELIR